MGSWSSCIQGPSSLYCSRIDAAISGLQGEVAWQCFMQVQAQVVQV